ncbi:glycosyl transferase family 1 [Neorhizobium alkalisoli]|uniref:Glycosyl transferase family 1 n=2 Tax=Neorhizobium alkalisoli TaxID=528178 RepID=A0A561R3J4_9HYPH|nr:glycosyl transferase family 1 [Neorhizobium alkalisoli]
MHFDENYYVRMYPDLAHWGASALEHFNTWGWKENRNASVDFDTYFYKETYLGGEDATVSPLLHFEKTGRAAGNLTRPQHSFSLVETTQKASVGSVAIHCHAFYLSLLPELFSYLSDLKLHYKLYITVVRKVDVAAAEEFARDVLPAHVQVEVRLVPNQGRDLAPLFVGLEDVLEEHDIWCHVHTKFSPHVHFGSKWRAYLLDQLVGSDERVNGILAKFEQDDKLGLVYPDNYFEIKKHVDHGINRDALAELFSRLGVDDHLPEQLSHFAAGSMCWFRTKAMLPIVRAGLTIEEFGEEAAQIDGTLAHSLERALCLVPQKTGYEVLSYYAPAARPEALINPARCAIEDKDAVGRRWIRDTPAISASAPLPLQEHLPPFNSSGLQVHWVIPDFGPGAGGHTTIFRFVKMLDDQGFNQTIWIQNAFNHGYPAVAKARICAWYTQVSPRVVVRFLPDDVEAISGDVVIATDCWTAYPVARMTRFIHRFYFIQDWESEFHPAGELRFMASATYDFGFTALTAGKWLESKAKGAGMDTVCWYLGADLDVYQPATEPREYVSYRSSGGKSEMYNLLGRVVPANSLEQFVPSREIAGEVSETSPLPRIAFYARAYTPRRAVRLGLEALDLLARRGWRFHVDFFGEELDFAEKPFSYTAHGVLKPQDLAVLYQETDLGMVFSCTNYSLVPLEMMACDLPVLEIDTESTRAAYQEGSVWFSAPSVHAVADSLELLLSNPDERKALVENAKSFLETASWERSGEIVANAIREKVTGSGALDVAPLVSSLVADAQQRLAAPALYERPKVSIFIPTYNAGPEFDTVMDAVVAQKMDERFEIVVIDSGSTDETLSILEEKSRKHPIKLHSISSSEFGHGKTRNMGIDMALGDVVAIITQDACPASSAWLDRLVGGFQASDRVAGVFGRHVAYPLHELFEGKGLNDMFDRFRRVGPVFSWEREMPGFVERGSPTWQYHLQFYSDNNSCMRKSVWRELPYPDVPWGEDMIWASEIIRLGFEKVYVDDAVVYHSHDYDPRKLTEVGLQEGRMFLKHFGMHIVPDVDEGDRDRVAWDMALNAARNDEKMLEQLDAATPQLVMRRALQHAALIRGRMMGAREMADALRAPGRH